MAFCGSKGRDRPSESLTLVPKSPESRPFPLHTYQSKKVLRAGEPTASRAAGMLRASNLALPGYHHHHLAKAPAGDHCELVMLSGRSTLMLGSTFLGSAVVQLLPSWTETPLMSPLHQAVNSGYLLPGWWHPPVSAESGERGVGCRRFCVVILGVKRALRQRLIWETALGKGFKARRHTGVLASRPRVLGLSAWKDAGQQSENPTISFPVLQEVHSSQGLEDHACTLASRLLGLSG